MKTKNFIRSLVCMLAIVLGVVVYRTSQAAAESDILDEASFKTYLEKKTIADPGSCLVEDTKLEIIGIADLVPGQQTEVYYHFEYILRCNRSRETKKGQDVLKAARLRNGQWIDRETAAIISK